MEFEQVLIKRIKSSSLGFSLGALFILVSFNFLPVMILVLELPKAGSIMDDGLFIVAIIAVLITFYFGNKTLQAFNNYLNPANSKIFTILTKGYNKEVWVYVKELVSTVRVAYVIDVSKSSIYTFVVKPKGEPELHLQFNHVQDSNSLNEYLFKHRPEFTYGYSKEYKKLFK